MQGLYAKNAQVTLMKSEPFIETEVEPARQTEKPMRFLITLALLASPAFAAAETIEFEDGPWIAIPAGYDVTPMLSPADEIKAIADLDGDPTVTTKAEIEMITLLSQILGTAPVYE